VGSWLAPSRADAFERQWHAGASLGYVALIGRDVFHGFGGGLNLTYGLTDAFNLMAEIDVTGHPSASALFASGGVGVGYVVDILQWVPYVGLLVGAADIADLSGTCGAKDTPACQRFWFNLEAPFGLDYTVSRSFAIGVAGHYQLLFSGSTPVQGIGAFARVEYLWRY